MPPEPYIENTIILVRLRNLKKELEAASGRVWEEHAMGLDVLTKKVASYHLRCKIEDITIFLYGMESYRNAEPTGEWSWSPYFQRDTYCNVTPGLECPTPLETWESCQGTLEQWLERPDEIAVF